MPKVSVIVPNYNHAPYLKQRIDSILSQTYQEFEVIILDDCSGDNSREIIEQYRDHPKVAAIIYNEINSGGPFYQWKKGIELAKGEYVWMAESDDWCEKTLLDTLVQALDENGKCVLGYVQTHAVNEDDLIEKTSAHNKPSEYVDGKTYISQYLAASCSIWNASMTLFRKSCYFNISQQFTTFKMSGDWLFYIEMAKQGDVFISGKVLNYFRNHRADVSGKMYSSGNNYLEELKILKILKNDSLISYPEFKRQLLDKYIKFIVFKHKFDHETNKMIKESFYNDMNESYKWFLYFGGKFSLLKIKVRRRLNLLFK